MELDGCHSRCRGQTRWPKQGPCSLPWCDVVVIAVGSGGSLLPNPGCTAYRLGCPGQIIWVASEPQFFHLFSGVLPFLMERFIRIMGDNPCKMCCWVHSEHSRNVSHYLLKISLVSVVL